MNYKVVLIPAIIAATGCSLGPKPQTALHDFGVSVRVPDGNVDPAPISVSAPKWLWDNRIRYRLLYAAPTQVRFYTLDRWIASPPELFEQELAADGKVNDYPLRIRLLDFEQQFDAPDKARVLLRFYVEAYDRDTKKVIAARELSLEKITQTADAAGAVSAFAELTRQAGDNIHEWLLRAKVKP